MIVMERMRRLRRTRSGQRGSGGGGGGCACAVKAVEGDLAGLNAVLEKAKLRPLVK